MSQAANFSVPTTGPATPASMAARENDSFLALLTQHRGSTRPAYLTSGLWINDSAAPTWVLNLYNGSVDIPLFTINISTNVVTPAGIAKRNYAATGAPTASNDGSAGQGYSIGSHWVDTTNKVAYICVDATTGAAVWRPIALPTTNVAGYYLRANGVSYDLISVATMISDLSVPTLRAGSVNQSRLVFSGGNLTIIPIDGDSITINGINRSIQSVVPTAPVGLAASTLYYIYAVWNGTGISLSPVTTGWVRNAQGLAVRSDNASQTLVGMIWLPTAASFTGAFVRSYANRTGNQGFSTNGSNLTCTTATNAELPNMPRCGFLKWAEESVRTNVSAVAQQSAATTMALGNYVNGGCPAINGQFVPAGNVNTQQNMQCEYVYGAGAMPEGYNYCSIAASTGTGTLTVLAGSRVSIAII